MCDRKRPTSTPKAFFFLTFKKVNVRNKRWKFIFGRRYQSNFAYNILMRMTYIKWRSLAQDIIIYN